LNGAHTTILYAEKQQGWDFTGAMVGGLDDRVYALQAADVIAWTHHRKLEAEYFGDDFAPLTCLIQQVTKIADRRKLHIPIEVPLEGVEFFAERLNHFIESEGKLWTWEEMLASQVKAEGIDAEGI
jgi:hypothetical protein